MKLEYTYQVGGSLSKDSPSYVQRKADNKLFNQLKKGEFCYVFNSRQMGKSSLRLRVKDNLEKENYKCVSIDLTMFGGEKLIPSQWYFGLATQLWREFNLLTTVNLKKWWQAQENLSSIQKLGLFIEDVILKFVPNQIVIFIDEIDNVKSLDFSTDDFFAYIRFCYNQRAEKEEYRRLNWALFGVTTPYDLISNKNKTPFNIGIPIKLKGFEIDEVSPLLKGLESKKITNSLAVLKRILYWTGGQPFLTQKVCQLVSNQEDTFHNQKVEDNTDNIRSPYLKNMVTEMLMNHSDLNVKVDTIVQHYVINNWEFNDYPEHLRTIQNRLLKHEKKDKILKLYQKILTKKKVDKNKRNNEQIQQLLLSGIITYESNQIKLTNLIYETIFNLRWVQNHLKQSSLGDRQDRTFSETASHVTFSDHDSHTTVNETKNTCHGKHKTQFFSCNVLPKNINHQLFKCWQNLTAEEMENFTHFLAQNYPEKAHIMLTILSKYNYS